MAYVATGLAPFEKTGPPTVAYHLLRQFAKMKNLDITLIASTSATKRDIVVTFGNQFEKVVRMDINQPLSYYGGKMVRAWKALKNSDLVHVNDIYAIRNAFIPIFAYVGRKVSVYSYHGWISKEIREDLFYGEKAWAAKRKAEAKFFNFEKSLWSRIVVNSKHMKEIALKFEGFNEQRICLIPHGLDLDRIRKAPTMSLDGEVKLLFVGGLEQRKGFDLLVRALSMLDLSTKERIRLYVAGSGPHERIYKSLAATLKVDKYIRFFGLLRLDQCYALYKSCDIFVAPSRREGFGLTVLEALGSGIPIIAANSGAIPEIIEHERNGFLVPLSPSEIAGKIKFLIEHPEIREQISKNNLKDAGKHPSWHVIARQYVELYKSLVP